MPYSNPSINGIDFTSIAIFDVVTESGTSRTLSLSDGGRYIRCTSPTTVTITIPTQASVAWTDDVEILFEQAGGGKITFTSSATINSRASSVDTAAQYSVVALKRVAEDVWTLFGDLA